MYIIIYFHSEKRCAETDRFFCPMEEKCVSEYRRCDYNLDCYDAADEKNCKGTQELKGYKKKYKSNQHFKFRYSVQENKIPERMFK